MKLDDKTGPLELSELQRVLDEDGFSVVVYEVTYRGANFGYLYVNPDHYSLAWTAPARFEFDGKQPFTFIEEQFCIKTPSFLKFMDLRLPNKSEHRQQALDVKGFYYDCSISTLVLIDDNSLCEYDLLQEQSRNEYMSILTDPHLSSKIIFARYDSVVKTKESSFSFCFTLEAPSSATREWEFAINLPRNLKLSERAFRWIARNHRVGGISKTDLKESRRALANITNPAKNLYVQ